MQRKHVNNVNKVDENINMNKSYKRKTKHVFKISKIHSIIFALVVILFLSCSYCGYLTNNKKVYAQDDYKIGDEVTINVKKGTNISYKLTGTKTGSGWNVDAKNNIKVDGEKVKSQGLFESVCEAYLKVKGSKDSKELLVDLMECVAKGDGQKTWSATFETTRIKNNKKNSILLLGKGENKFDWQKSGTSSFKDIILKGNSGKVITSSKDLTNPLNCSTKDNPEMLLLTFLYNGSPVGSSLSDEEMFRIFISSNSLPAGVTKTSSSGGTSTGKNVAEGDNYKASWDTEDKKICIILKDSKGKKVATFLYGRYDEKKNYTKESYTNDSTKKVKLVGSEANYKLVLNTSKDTNFARKDILKRITTSDGKKKTSSIDAYYSDIAKSKKNKVSSKVFVAVADNEQTVSIYTATSCEGGEAKLKHELTISNEEINKTYKPEAALITQGEWNFLLCQDDVVMAYKDNQKKDAYYYDIKNVKKMFIQESNYCNMLVAVKKGEDNKFDYKLPLNAKKPFAVIRVSQDVLKKNSDNTIDDIKNEMYNDIAAENQSYYIETVALKEDVKERAGSKAKSKLSVKKCYTHDPNNKDFDFPPDIPLNVIMEKGEMFNELMTSSGFNGTSVISAKLGAEKKAEKESFKNDVIKYGRIILMFLVLLSIIYTGIISVTSGFDPQKRALVKDRLKHTLIAVIICACLLPIYNLVVDFAQNAYSDLGAITATYEGPTYNSNEGRIKINFIVNFIGKIINILAKLANWFVDFIMSTAIMPGQKTTIMKLVFDVYDENGNVSSIMPFTQAEWSMYMYAYRLLASLAIALISIALVKLIYDMIFAGGNYQKEVEVRESIKRIILSIILITLAPYCFRLVLLVFNYMTGMLPIDPDTAKFDINFNSGGFVSAVANLSFATVKLRIYILFLVRKVMITFMLLSSPVVLGIWAISKKFRSISLWIGESLSNIATQFCYAMVFIVVMLITYDGQNPFITLIVVNLIPKFASFFSSSLQGLAQRWGGINEEKIAGEIANDIKKTGKKIVKGVRKGGVRIMKATNFIDKKGVSNVGRKLNNIGAVMSLNLTNYRTKGDMYANKEKLAYDEYVDDKSNYKDYENDKDRVVRVDPEAKKYYEERIKYEREQDEGTINPEERVENSTIYQTGGNYDIINNYFETKKKVNFSRHRYEAFKKQNDNYNGKGIGRVQAFTKNRANKNIEKIAMKKKIEEAAKKTASASSESRVTEVDKLIKGLADIRKTKAQNARNNASSNGGRKKRSSYSSTKVSRNRELNKILINVMTNDTVKTEEKLEKYKKMHEEIAIDQIGQLGNNDMDLATSFVKAVRNYESLCGVENSGDNSNPDTTREETTSRGKEQTRTDSTQDLNEEFDNNDSSTSSDYQEQNDREFNTDKSNTNSNSSNDNAFSNEQNDTNNTNNAFNNGNYNDNTNNEFNSGNYNDNTNNAFNRGDYSDNTNNSFNSGEKQKNSFNEGHGEHKEKGRTRK